VSNGNDVAFLRSDARKPERPAIVIGSGTPLDMAPDAIPTEFPGGSLVEPQQVIFNGADGMKFMVNSFLPANLDRARRYPAVLFFHGGSRRKCCSAGITTITTAMPMR